jgi:hypothetical protein
MVEDTVGAAGEEEEKKAWGKEPGAWSIGHKAF